MEGKREGGREREACLSNNSPIQHGGGSPSDKSAEKQKACQGKRKRKGGGKKMKKGENSL